MDPKTLEQERASFAFKVVSEVKKKFEDVRDVREKYTSYVERAPTMIFTNGLGATLAYFLSKLEKPINDTEYKNIDPDEFKKADSIAYAYLYKHLSTWLAEGNGSDSVFKGLTNNVDPLKYIMDNPAAKVVALVDEALAILNWIKRFAKAMLEGGS